MAGNNGDAALVWLPEQSQEDALHATRLLPVEERPFQRVTKTLLSKNSLVRPISNYLPSPPPEGDSEAVDPLEYQIVDPSQLQRFHEDILLDFAALESSITRIQLIQSSNERERQRYATEKAKILETAQAVRENTAQLHVQLAEAQNVLQLRKGYDELATKILDDKKLKSRDGSKAEIERLEKEIEELEQESADYEDTWVSRREYFNRIVAEGDAMIRLIRGIKDDAETEADKDDMETDGDKDDDMEDGDDLDDGEEKTQRSRLGTPVADGRSPQPMDTGESTPLPENGAVGDSAAARLPNKHLSIEDSTRQSSYVGSPLAHTVDVQDDTEME